MQSKDYIDRIVKASVRFVDEAKAYQDAGLTDYNLIAESALIPILNIFFDLNLENVNARGKRNFPAVDLADDSKRVAFQITATSDLEKVRSTLEKFTQHSLQEKYDSVYVYILTEKQKSYSEKALKNELPEGFEFAVKTHILDMSDLRGKLIHLPLNKLEQLSRIFEHEFSPVQIESRQKEYQTGYLKKEAEKLYLNFLRIGIASYLYIADISVCDDDCKQRINDWRAAQGKRPKQSFDKLELLNNAIRFNEIYVGDYIVRENKIITFRELTRSSEPLSRFVDKGTIISITPKEYYEQSDAHMNSFRDLLRRMLTTLCKGRDMEWSGIDQVMRFRNYRREPNEKKITWVGKKKATKTVIFKIKSKKDDHLICFRHLAFSFSFQLIASEWYLALNPTWSFTNPGGKNPSRFGPAYMSGLKRLERNNAVCNYYRFFGHFLSHPNLFSDYYPYLTIYQAEPFDFSPSLVESMWLPPKVVSMPQDVDADLDIDRELTKTLLG